MVTQKTIHVKELPPLTLKIETKCGVVQTHPDLSKHFPHLPSEWEGCDSLMLVIGVPDWGSIGTLVFTYSIKHKIGYLAEIFLWPDFRGKGIGREMNRFAMEVMKEKGVEKVYTSIVRKEWIPRMEAAGFKLVEGTERLFVKGLGSSNPTVFVELRMLKDVPAIIGPDMKPYGPFTTGRVYAIPKENARIFLKLGLAVATRQEAKKPTLKEMFKGEVLNGYVEAALVKPLVEEEEYPGAVLERQRKAREKAEKLLKKIQEERGHG